MRAACSRTRTTDVQLARYLRSQDSTRVHSRAHITHGSHHSIIESSGSHREGIPRSCSVHICFSSHFLICLGFPADHAKSMFLAASKNSRRRPRENGSQPASSSRPRWGRARPTWQPYPCRHPRSLRPHWATPLRPRNRPRPPSFDDGGAPVGANPKSPSIATKRLLRGLRSARGPARALLWTRTPETESGHTGTALCGGDGGCSE